MNILITGAGLIGSHTARQAVDAGNKTKARCFFTVWHHRRGHL